MNSSDSIDSAIRNTIRHEIAAELAPLRGLLQRLEKSTPKLELLSELLAPLFLPAALRGGVRNVLKASVKARIAAKSTGKPGRKPTNVEACAVKACGRRARSKGYCSAHYQKLRLMVKTGRLPAEWTDFPGAGAVADVKLPRGRSARKGIVGRASAA